jgi:hypothetical protein
VKKRTNENGSALKQVARAQEEARRRVQVPSTTKGLLFIVVIIGHDDRSRDTPSHYAYTIRAGSPGTSLAWLLANSYMQVEPCKVSESAPGRGGGRRGCPQVKDAVFLM